MSILKVVFVIIGTLIGAGFASGQEVYIFFYSYGVKGILGIIISSGIIGFTIYKTLKIIKENNIENYKGFLDYFIKKEKLKELINSIINIFILISFYVMIAGFGAYLEQEINLNSFIGRSILAFLCVILFKTNIKGIVKINEILIPILIAVVLVIRNSKYSKYRYQHFEQPYSFTKKWKFTSKLVYNKHLVCKLQLCFTNTGFDFHKRAHFKK